MGDASAGQAMRCCNIMHGDYPSFSPDLAAQAHFFYVSLIVDYCYPADQILYLTFIMSQTMMLERSEYVVKARLGASYREYLEPRTSLELLRV